jgi:hypothetical protein
MMIIPLPMEEMGRGGKRREEANEGIPAARIGCRRFARGA